MRGQMIKRVSEKGDGLKRDCQIRRGRDARGFVHVLLLVLFITGLGLWGISEWVLRTAEVTQESEETESGVLQDARRALMEYALNPPPRLQADNRPGRFSALAFREDGTEVAAPYRYFSLPCPDVGADGNWDGVSDVLYEDTPGDITFEPCNLLTLNISVITEPSGYLPNARASRSGRFPWRSFSGQLDGRQAYIHGAGDRDLRDAQGNRLWYVASYNMTRDDIPLNLHSQLRQNDGWLQLADLGQISPGFYFNELCGNINNNGSCTTANQTALSDVAERRFGRVAGIAVSPGARGAYNDTGIPRPQESVNITAAAVTLNFGYDAYLEETTSGYLYGAIAGLPLSTTVDINPDFRTSPLVMFNNRAEEVGADKISYFTIDDLAAESDLLFSGEGEGIIGEMLEGKNGNIGVRDLLHGHLSRYGYLPSPAAFGEGAAQSRNRRAGVQSVETVVTVNTVEMTLSVHSGAVAAGVSVTITALLPVRNIGRVYLQPETHLAGVPLESFGNSPPYNLGLYALDTALNDSPMPADLRTTLMDNNIYPHDHLFGFLDPDAAYQTAANVSLVRSAGNPFAPANARVYLARRAPLRNVSFTNIQVPGAGDIIHAALAEPAQAYIHGSLADNTRDANGSGDSLAQSPSYGLRVELPTGTRFELSGTSATRPTIFLPGAGRLNVRGVYDRDSGRWRLTEPLSQPALVQDNSDRFITITAVLHSLALDSANVGFLPIAESAVRHLDTGATLILGAGSGATSLPGTDQNITVAGGVRLPFNHSVSRLQADLRLFTNARLHIRPFPPPGRPAYNATDAPTPGNQFSSETMRAIPLPSALFINFFGSLIEQGEEFVLPLGTEIQYPANSALQLGADFTFPAGTRALLPVGAVMTVQVVRETTLPDGGSVPPENVSTLAVTLVHGGVMDLWGPEADMTGAFNNVMSTLSGGARIVLRNGYEVGAGEEMFDMEMPAFYEVGGEAATVSLNGGIVQPLTGRSVENGAIDLGANLRLHTWTRARFLTRARNLPLRGRLGSVTVHIEHPATTIGGNNLPQTTETVESNVIRNVVLPGAREIMLTLRFRAGDETDTTRIVEIPMRINEQTEFMIPPGDWNTASLMVRPPAPIVTPLGDRMLATAFVFPEGTAIYDPNFPAEVLPELSLNDVNNYAVLNHELTVELATMVPDGGVAVHQLVLLPDSDVLSDEEVLPAGGLIDAVQGVGWAPESIYTLPGVAPDLSATSPSPIYLYFPTAVTLTNRASTRILGQYTGPPPGTTVTVAYSSPVDPADFLARSADSSGEWLYADETPAQRFLGLYAQPRTLPDRYPTVGFLGEDSEMAMLYGADFEIPAGGVVMLPPGSTLRYISPAAHGATISADNAEYIMLPENAVLLPPVTDITLSLTSAIVTTTANIDGVGGTTFFVREGSFGGHRPHQPPPIFNLGGFPVQTTPTTVNNLFFGFSISSAERRGFAMVAHSDMMDVSPVVMYTGDTFLFDGDAPQGVRDEVVSVIPAGTRGDIFGNITRREAVHLPTGLLPSDTAELLRNFPMVYAVAEDCRRGAVNDGLDCAEAEGEGLEFAVESGEDVVLEEPIIAGGNILISVHSEIDDAPEIDVEVYAMADFYGGVAATVSTNATVVFVAPNGETQIGVATTAAVVMPAPNDVVLVSLPASAAEDAEIRVYMNLPAAITDPNNITEAHLADAHYAVLPAVTLYVGGFTEATTTNIALAAGVLELTTFSMMGTSNLRIGFNANVNSNDRNTGIDFFRKPYFGKNSYITDTFGGAATLRVPLENYTPVLKEIDVSVTINTASRYTNLDTAGEIVFQTETGDRLAIAGRTLAFLPGSVNIVDAVRPDLITLDTTQGIEMEQGYLWQGYINPANQDVSLSISPVAALTAGGEWDAEMFARVHPADELLNFWGSGLERAEGMDSRSIARRPQVPLDSVYTFNVRNFSPSELLAPNTVPGMSPPVFAPEIVGITLPVPDSITASEGGLYFLNTIYWRGFRSPIVPGAGQMRVRVRDATTGTVIVDTQAAEWVPRARSGERLGTHNADLSDGYVPWGGPNAAPFYVPDQAYASNSNEFWAHRRMVDLDGGTTTEEDSIILLTVDGTEVSATFNMPAFPLRSYSFRPRPAWDFGKASDIGAITVSNIERAALPGCAPTPHRRVPGALLGRSPDVRSRVGGDCVTPGFSGRVRRESILTDIFSAVSATLTLETYLYNADERNSVIFTSTGGYSSSTVEIVNIIQPETRRALGPDPTNPADTPVDAEVRAAVGNLPAAFNDGHGTAPPPDLQNPESYVESGDRIQNTLTVGFSTITDNMREVVAADFEVPLHSDLVFYMDRAYNTVSIAEYDDTGRQISVFARICGQPQRQQHLCDDTDNITDAPYSAVDLPPGQTLSLGANFRITGPGALVPPFGGQRADSTADVYAARSRLFYGILSNDPDKNPDGTDDDPNFQLHNVYSDPSYECTPSAISAAGATCAQMQNPDNARYWIPMISGVMAFEAVEITPTGGDSDAEAELDNGVRLVVPQPRTEVLDENSTTIHTLHAGSIIYPRTGVVIPSVPFTVGGRLIVPEGAVAAVDVNPSTPPVPVRYVRRHATFRAWDMLLPPVLASDGTDEYIVEPMGFDSDVLVNFRHWEVNDDTDFFGLTVPPAPFVGQPPHRIPRDCEPDFVNSWRFCRFQAWGVGHVNLGTWGRYTSIEFTVFGINEGSTNDDWELPNLSVTVTVRYDGTFARGFLVNDKMTDILSDYYSGENIFTRDHGFTTFFPRRGYQIHTASGMRQLADRTTTQRYGYHRRNTSGLMEGDPLVPVDEESYNAPYGNTAAELGNPLSWQWMQRNPTNIPNEAFVPMGMARQFYFHIGADYTGDATDYYGEASAPRLPRPIHMSRDLDYGCGLPNPRRYDTQIPVYPTSADGFQFASVPCLGRRDARTDQQAARDTPYFIRFVRSITSALEPEEFGHLFGGGAYYPVGVLAGSSATGPNTVFFRDGLEIEEDDDEFFSLRLPHLIEIPEYSEITIFAENGAAAYPHNRDNFFQFPDGSVANILQVDAASWESVHPFVSRYMPGAVLSSDGGVYPIDSSGGDIDALTDNTRRALAAAEQMEVQENNDGHRRVDIGGRRVMHYARSESIPGSYTYSSTPVHTNVWVRLTQGGYFIEDSGNVINLPAETVVNPILGTYISPDTNITPAQPPLRSNYQAFLETTGTLVVARPALTIPVGTTVRVGAAGANITNVKAAALFSIKPIDDVSCPNGEVGDNFPQTGLNAETLDISQMREGISENQFPADGSNGVFFTLGHPCAWVDDSENTDGDRFFVYRSRRRYWDDTHQTRIRSNDRTYLLGGRLHLSV